MKLISHLTDFLLWLLPRFVTEHIPLWHESTPTEKREGKPDAILRFKSFRILGWEFQYSQDLLVRTDRENPNGPLH